MFVHSLTEDARDYFRRFLDDSITSWNDSEKFFKEQYGDYANASFIVNEFNKTKKGQKCFYVALDFKLTPAIAENVDPVRAQSIIPTKVLLINGIRSHFHYTIQELVTLEMDETLNVSSVDRALKPKHKHLEDKGLIHIS